MRRGDEINLIRPGRDYGFPFLCVQCTPYSVYNYPVTFTAYATSPEILNDFLIENDYNVSSDVENFVYPLYSWEDYNRSLSIAPSGMAYYEQNNRKYLLVATLANSTLEVLEVHEGTLIRQIPLLRGMRFRDIFVRDEQTFYILTINPGGSIN